MNLIDVLKGLNPKPVLEYRTVILFSDILDACKLYGQDNPDIVKAKLIELEKQGLITLVYDKLGYELLIGVKPFS